MTLAAVVTAYAFGVAYVAATGTYLFYDAYIPIAVFLGMHLLFTDPSTSPRSEAGRIVFGMLYGLGVIALFALFNRMGLPTFYNKLLPVPILNLLVRRIDRAVASPALRWLDPARVAPDWTPGRRRLAYTSLWTGIFVVMSGVGALGDGHRGQWLPYWEETCGEGRARACDYLAAMQLNYCYQGSGWACNELGIQQAVRGGNRRGALASFRRACELGFGAGCENVTLAAGGGDGWARAHPPVEELPIVLRGSKGPVLERDPDELYALACRRGWQESCDRRTAGTDR